MGNSMGRPKGAGPSNPASSRNSPPDSPGPPLTFSPQIPMTPPIKTDEIGAPRIPDYRGPTQVPTVITWSHGGTAVEVQGSWDNWTSRQPLHRHGKDFNIVKMLPPGVFQYKFIVDREYKYAPDQPAMFDEMGNVNNVLEVQEYFPENLDNLAGFRQPQSPPSSYNNMMPPADDYAKEPPVVPPQLQLTLLNAPTAPDAPNTLPRPQHVILNHMYYEASRNVWGTRVLGTTHRYRTKYVTVVLYKPERSKPSEQAQQ
mmetsp:Transcript_43713/g.52859  ORF Transcript_43713/g.52859 Transcript_43713/m.52859 type:complete len:257 (+) Transcript_43713:223-993(+)|eukprot:CAMPEP_0197857266 /NCGR_PEP_ID=MMETSP1438-20131217/30152_1 /TAXON_ID=1461541 /ORGANISM="Pterosperma sp., Strain CCMP1384" /LENGTH=256 /DNA_ID=CAMNT_0043473031 /DNA_START=193 /DNA_END=963 /DNA_ORIENTATION=+